MEVLKKALAFFLENEDKDKKNSLEPFEPSDVEIKNIQLHKEVMDIHLSNIPKETNVEVWVVNMGNKEVVKKIKVTSHSKAILDLKSLCVNGKYAFYLTAEQKKFRLKPSKAFRMYLTDWSFAKELNDFLIVPYVTIKNNFSLEVMDPHYYKTSKKLPHVLELISEGKGNILLEGKVYAEEKYLNDLELMMRKRGSDLEYHFPVERDGMKWRTAIDFAFLKPSKGIWDYYLKINSDSFRINVVQNSNLNQLENVFSARREARVNNFYITKNNYLSSKIQASVIYMDRIEAKISGGCKVKCTGVLESSLIKNATGKEEVSILTRNYNERITVPVKLRKITEELFDYSFEIDYRELIPENNETQRWDVFLTLPFKNDSQMVRFKVDCEQLAYQSRVKWDCGSIYQIYLYSTVNKHLSIVFKDLSVEREITNMSLRDQRIKLDGYAYLDTIEWRNKEDVKRELVIRDRETENEYVLPLKGVKNNFQSHGYCYNYSGFELELNLNCFINLGNGNKKIFDFFIRFHYKDNIKERRLGNKLFDYYKDDIIDRIIIEKETFNEIAYLTYTPSGNVKLEVNRVPHEAMKYLSEEYWDQLGEDIWLIGERSNTAQDTGYHFFKYCREMYPEKKVYYAIDPDSNEIENVSSLGNVLYIGSIDHYKIAAKASAFIGSHDLEYFLPAKAIEFESYKKGKRIFLQHGVLGRKNVEYHKAFYRYPFNVFCVSSTSEKNLVVNKLGYDKEDVAITGLTRFDNLVNKKTNKNSILFIPTWRDWLLTEDQFLESNYFKKYKGLLNHPKLHSLLDTHNVELTFFPHYRMQPFVEHFDFAHNKINVVKLGEKDVQNLLLENDLMVTDYSSVSFDFNYMDKPVLFYHFDRESFFRKGLLRPIEETFVGDICFTEDFLLKKLKSYIENGFQEKELFLNKKHLIFDRTDLNNCERVYNEVTDQI
ncbi:CDP-glycerol glycerophosphotransferase family protein [Halobacillus massiliensis]|uniref:CDP-glycerol glycerophosphotransferase family protein n=1 Tax=Halobacillus massiliensis TaxID=1926286 RepID=UPI0009E38AD5|nr:CDP-glycerol glycerophosphotransferase family protein [Halobacillus massiliensis]